MTDHLRPCPRCARHARVDAHVCPFCGAALPFTHRLPVIGPLEEARPAPKYGGPPLRRPPVLGILLLVLAVIGVLIWVWRG